MKINTQAACSTFPCADVNHAGYYIPQIEVEPAAVTAALISEATAPAPEDGYYAGCGLFAQTTLLAFRDAGIKADSIEAITARGVYLTTAIKCPKLGYTIQTGTIKTCSVLLEQELAQFPNIRVYLLMGDAAIKALNEIARRQGKPRPVPAGATYKIRSGEFHYNGARVFPSYLQAGPSFFIEKSKRKMIAEDIAAALRLI